MELEGIIEVKQLYCDGYREVNDLNDHLKAGWVILGISTISPTPGTDEVAAFVYSIGRRARAST